MNKESYPDKFNLMHLLEVERTKNNLFFRTVLIEKNHLLFVINHLLFFLKNILLENVPTMLNL